MVPSTFLVVLMMCFCPRLLCKRRPLLASRTLPHFLPVSSACWPLFVTPGTRGASRIPFIMLIVTPLALFVCRGIVPAPWRLGPATKIQSVEDEAPLRSISHSKHRTLRTSPLEINPRTRTLTRLKQSHQVDCQRNCIPRPKQTNYLFCINHTTHNTHSKDPPHTRTSELHKRTQAPRTSMHATFYAFIHHLVSASNCQNRINSTPRSSATSYASTQASEDRIDGVRRETVARPFPIPFQDSFRPTTHHLI